MICLENLINVYRADEKNGMSFLLSYKIEPRSLEGIFYSS